MNYKYCHIDFETFSAAPLKDIGAYRYFWDDSTDVLCCAYAFDNEPIQLWFPGDPYPFEGFDGIFLAWNSNFERICWRVIMEDLYQWPQIDLDQFQCVAAQARCQALPGQLDKCSQFLPIKIKKDMEGHRLMMRLCKPPSDKIQGDFWKRYANDALEKHEIKMLSMGLDPEQVALRCHHENKKIKRLAEYCKVDVEAERQIHDVLEPWNEDELEAFYCNEEINDRGVAVDVAFAESATFYAEEENAYFREELKRLTGEYVEAPRQFQKIKDWFLPKVSDEVKDMISYYEDGIKKYTLDANARANMLLQYEADPDFISPELAEFIQILDDAGKSTIAKYKGICARSIKSFNPGPKTPRVHGLYIHAGASQTLRYSSKGLQTHNLKRYVHKQAPDLIQAFKNNDDDYVHKAGNPIHLLSELIRPTFISSDVKHRLVWGDWSAIEARVLPWLAEPDRDAKYLLDLFRNDEDVYIKVASEILHKKEDEVTDDERQSHGKVPQLSLGYGGGFMALLAMAKGYRVHMEEDAAKSVVVTWRKTNPWAPRFWENVGDASMSAIRHEGKRFRAGRLEYHYNSTSLAGLGALWCKLPNGLHLCYPGARVELVKTKWGAKKKGITAMKAAWHPKKGTNIWPRTNLWPGLLVENAAQAVAGCILKEALMASVKYDLRVVMHTHDEIICEDDDEVFAKAQLKDLMERKLDWCPTLPMKVDVESGWRYKVKDTLG